MITVQRNDFLFFTNKFLNRQDGYALEKQEHGVASCSHIWEEYKGQRGRKNASLKDADPEMGGLDSSLFKNCQ